MAEEDAIVKEELSNSCCIAWKEKYAKLKERYSKLEDGRNALRKGLSIFEQQITKIQSENLTLKKAYESEKVRADNESEEKAKESALRASLESEVGSLRSNILSLQQNPGPASQDLEREMAQHQEVLSEKDAEVSRLKELLENERTRADSEKKKAEAERKKADDLRKKLKSEKNKADEERRLVDIERKKAEENRLRLETAMKDADEVKLKLASETSKLAEMKKKLETEVQNRMEDRKSADSSISKAVEQTKLANTNRKIAMDEKRRADDLSKQLDQHRQRIEILKKEIVELKSSTKLVDRLPDKEREVEEKLAQLEMKKLEDKKKVEAYKKKAAEEKCRADQLSCELKNNKQRLEELQKEIHVLISSRSFAESPLHSHDRSFKYQTAKMKFLKKQLKLEKMVVKHSKEATELEKARNCLLQEELLCLKQEFSQFSKRLNLLDKYFVCRGEGIHDLEKVNLKNQQFGVEPYKMHSLLKDGLARVAGGGETDSFRENMEGSASLLAISGGNGTRNVSGINSKLEPLLKGFNKKVLQSSAINSSWTSFSDRPLVGSQERPTSGTTSAKFAEENSNLPAAILRLSCDSKEKCNENLATITDTSAKSPISGFATERRGLHQKKRKRSIESLHSEKLPLLHTVLESQTDKSANVKRCLLPDVQGNICNLNARSYKKRKASFEEQNNCHLNVANRENANLKMLGIEGSDIHTKSTSSVQHLSETAHGWKDRSDALGDFELVIGNNYMKLLDLDNNVDEESYRLAVEMPLSPTLPEIECQSSNALVVRKSDILSDKTSLREFSHMKENLAPLEHFDVLDVEIDSNTAKLDTLGASNNSSLQEISDHAADTSGLNGNGPDHSQITHANISNSSGESLGLPDTSACANERLKISGGSRDIPSSHSIPKCYVVFSDNDKDEGISRVYSAANNFIAQCPMVSSSNLFVRNILVFISNAQDLSAKEKASVFLSLVLHYVSEMAPRDIRNGWDRDSVLFIASFAKHIYAELSDENTGIIFFKSCNLYELLGLLEDFILHKKVLVFDDVCSGSKPSNNSRIIFFVNGNSVSLFSQAASVNLLVVGGIFLASLCAAVDHIGFICEASCNILRMSRSDTSFALTILHIFAYLCGPECFSIKEYSFVMAVVRSLVMLLEKLNPLEPNSCFPSLPEGLSNIWSDGKCPFSEGTFSMDVIATMLLDNLQNCAWSSVREKDLVDTIHPSTAGEQYDTEKTMDISAHREVVILHSVTDGNVCCLVDVLALIELVACFMSWDWTVENIVCAVFKMLESCLLEHVPAAIVILLAQLGRFGVSANGYEDIGVQNLRTWFLALLGQCDSKTVGLDIQFSIGTALLGLISLNFEEVVESSTEISEFGSQYDSANCLRKWFSLLSNEQQLSFRDLVSSSKSHQTGHIPLVQ
ncbi:uncharacterized protein LOC116031385 isoform X1 [Ipomoea triloba]|uniref:uncharacterized protein LOC116031385 isoform X1 n=1 Tax=Ipomoea triloba TaxID=35885 RepID=UPI00125D1474|nr:uncharacterized protein LOC116031385 isoform X1 [Ipomoea triloba]XP_031129434.1 uncharacterized protein LOC116031385 isoform X1 [Ipomoea triloba]XP_031129435.1 uncharacterized protein LOC116031385 isoform X1 [Ipomoea triloba]XP_031129436.1 uncharacterized protein LOC116031385 isoform X1 [Ipomoea triloba]XP_031129437.1 uncharacterized protein LOC116031385 isoform X1 [Ipomoea triloba]XP_031129438.1 uncharacterized protein LOC116031385 isoform X1 [Ipomoea triloba]XP_031129439.1 uncharacterize